MRYANISKMKPKSAVAKNIYRESNKNATSLERLDTKGTKPLNIGIALPGKFTKPPKKEYHFLGSSKTLGNIHLESQSAGNVAGTLDRKAHQGKTPIKSTTREKNRNQSGLEKLSSKISGNFYNSKPKLIDPIQVPASKLKNDLKAPIHLFDSLNSKVEKLIADNQDRKFTRAKLSAKPSCRSIDGVELGTHAPLNVNSFEK